MKALKEMTPQETMEFAATKVSETYTNNRNVTAELHVAFAKAQTQLHEATMLEVQSLFSVANSMMFPNDARTKAVARITELLNLT